MAPEAMALLIIGPPPPFFFGGGEGFHQPNLAKMEFHPGFRHSHGLHSAKEGVKYTRTYCLLKMRVASTLLPLHHPHHIHIITAEQPTMNSERERDITSPSHPGLLQPCQCLNARAAYPRGKPRAKLVFSKITQAQELWMHPIKITQTAG